MSPAPSVEEDAATIARASELLRTDPNAYWRDAELQEAQFEALERQGAAPMAEPPIDHMAIERKIAQDDVGRFETMMREDPAKYWRSPELPVPRGDRACDAGCSGRRRAAGSGAGRSRTGRGARTGGRRRGSSLNASPLRCRRNNSLSGADSRCR
jgi:hypothetical protein